MKKSDFYYNLPEELIAQTPLEVRDSSRLMTLKKDTGEIEHKKFTDIIDYLEEGDTLVLNDTKVLPARLIGEKEDTKAVIEVLLLKNIENEYFNCISPCNIDGNNIELVLNKQTKKTYRKANIPVTFRFEELTCVFSAVI